MDRKEWIGLADSCLTMLKQSAHDMSKQQTLSEFLEDLRVLMELTIVMVKT